MKTNKLSKLGAVLGLAIFAQAAQAVTVTPVSSVTNLGLGDLFQVDLVVSGLHDLGANPDNEIISAFDLGLGFDNTVIQANSITIGAGVTTVFGDGWLGNGNIADLTNGSIREDELNFDYANAKNGETYTGPSYSQAVRLSESSFIFPLHLLQAEQPDSFILGTIFFEAIGIGNSSLGLIDDSLYSGLAGVLDLKGLDGVTPLSLTAVQQNIDVAAVPVPAAVWLFGSAMFGLVGFSRNSRQARRLG